MDLNDLTNGLLYLAISIVAHSPDDHNSITDEGDEAQNPDAEPQEVVRHEILTRRKLIRSRKTIRNKLSQTAKSKLVCVPT